MLLDVFLRSYTTHSSDHTGLAVWLALGFGALVVVVAGLVFVIVRNRKPAA